MIQQLLFEIPFILSEFGGFGQINCIPHADRIDNYVKSAGSLELVLKCAFTKLAKFTKKIALANAFIASPLFNPRWMLRRNASLKM